jgi:hypothetical protein
MDMDNILGISTAGWSDSADAPLSRFLPPIPEGTSRSFLASLPASNAWVLDPFAALPRLPVEMARSGQRVLVTAGNPVNRFLLDLAAHPPREHDLQAALAEMAMTRKEGKRLETHLLALYNTICENCGRVLPAEAFLWEGKSGKLVGRIYNCSCGDGGEHEVTQADLDNAAFWARTDGLHRSRALERVTPGNDPERGAVEEALQFYPPRAVYALGTMINRLDSLSTSVERRRCISALLLHAADLANALWPHGNERPRPRQLSFPGVYRENNVWMALESGIKAWASSESSVALTLWPEDPPESGGVCIFEGPLRDLAEDLHEHSFKAVVTAIPRPNQAFWALSTLWAGWLWGHAAVGPFKTVLRRRRYDWQWHTEALRALHLNLVELLPTETPILGMLGEAEAPFLSAAFLAAKTSGLDLIHTDIRNETGTALFFWKTIHRDPKKQDKKPKNTKKILKLDVNYTRKIIREILEERGQPVAYLQLHIAILSALGDKGMLAWGDEMISNLEKNIHTALEEHDFTNIDEHSAVENGRWALEKWTRQQTLKGL